MIQKEGGKRVEKDESGNKSSQGGHGTCISF